MSDTKKPKPEDFLKAYEKLCEETGFRLNIVPVWIYRDDGTFSTKINTTIEPLPEKVHKKNVI